MLHPPPRLRHASNHMEELDQLDWAGGLSFVSYGVHVGVRANDPGVLRRVERALVPGLSPSPLVDHLFSLRTPDAESGFTILYDGPEAVCGSAGADPAVAQLQSTVHTTVAVHACDHVFVHAGAVAWRGRGIVIPGHSMSGKTELVHALVRAGATYYSDEYAVLDPEGRLHPYAKPLSLRTADGRHHRPVEQLGGRSGARPVPVELVVLTAYSPGAEWQPRVLSHGAGMLGLVEHCVSTRSHSELSLAVLRRLTLQATVISTPRGEAATAAARLIEMWR